MTREEAIIHIKDVIVENNTIAPNMVTFDLEKQALYMAIEALKQPEQKKGKWEQQTEPLGAYEVECAVCSVCNDCFDLGEEYSIEDIRKLFAYCPNCGAKMDKED